ncbi:serine_rich_CAS and FAT-like_CAS_C domain-containing protein p130CAS isoform X2 [Rhynchophorus ferrugineus]|uniref:serine_rich_CAS and FAT-like_CAS_C domain-containing protein p130CAS isoform X2 n=1 Tax=Rhynchophorus ferrugineus TaxID=354439 RepID=UPI003FCC29C1
MVQPFDVPPSQTSYCLAKALYDNVPDTPDELEFHKGDTLVVLEQNTSNITGWWLCTLRGKQGICPANRLRLIPGVYEDISPSRLGIPQFHETPSDNNCHVQRDGKRRSWQTNQITTPKKFNDVCLYDMPPSRCSPTVDPADCYDVPPRAIPVGNEPFRNCLRCSPAPSCASPISRESGEAYDIPRSLLNNPNQLTPSSSASSLTADSHSLSSSNRSSLINMPDYDVPKPLNRSPQLMPPISAYQATYDVPPSPRELPLQLNSALETLDRLQTETTSAVSKLLGFVSPNWRTREKLESTVMEIRLTVTRLKTSLHDLAEFGEGSLANASKASDKNLVIKLSPLVSAIRKSDNLIRNASDNLDERRWSIDVLARPGIEDKSYKPDELEQLIACARALTEDVRQIASFIQGNGLLLFKKESPRVSTSDNPEEYDYVSFDSKDNINKNHAQIMNELPKELQDGYDTCRKNADAAAFDGEYKELGQDDKKLLTFFATQIVTHHKSLTDAIDSFFKMVEHNQPPKIFLAYGKFVVLSAHKLVLIGDTVARNISRKDIKERALQCANALSDSLASSVNKTKQAALQFPSVNAVQEMVHSVSNISFTAKALKVCLVQAAQPL